MLIVCRKEGQMCNRLFHFSHLVSYAIENNQSIWYPYIAEFSPLFKNIKPAILKRKKILVHSGSLYELLLKIISWLFRHIPNSQNMYSCDGTNEFNLSQIPKTNSSRLIFLSGWLLRDYEALKRNREFIREIFAFGDNIISECEQKLTLPKANNSIVVGVHIRRGDYKLFQNGKYFYELDVYKSVIMQLMSLLSGQGRAIYFVVCTNDQEILKSNLLIEPNVFLNSGSQISDLCMLSKCDYIIGPPSTYSGWASFYGSVPLAYIMDKDSVISMSDFKVITG
jgi:hypothetical protein